MGVAYFAFHAVKTPMSDELFQVKWAIVADVVPINVVLGPQHTGLQAYKGTLIEVSKY